MKPDVRVARRLLKTCATSCCRSSSRLLSLMVWRWHIFLGYQMLFNGFWDQHHPIAYLLAIHQSPLHPVIVIVFWLSFISLFRFHFHVLCLLFSGGPLISPWKVYWQVSTSRLDSPLVFSVLDSLGLCLGFISWRLWHLHFLCLWLWLDLLSSRTVLGSSDVFTDFMFLGIRCPIPTAIVMESSSGPTRHVNQKWTSVYRLMVRFAVEIPENEKSIGRLTV